MIKKIFKTLINAGFGRNFMLRVMLKLEIIVISLGGSAYSDISIMVKVN